MIKTGLLLSSLALAGSIAQASLFDFTATLNGANEAPPNASAGTGTATFSYDSVAHTLAINASFSGLTGDTTSAHIHAATASPFSGTSGVATTTPNFAGFPTGVKSGTYSVSLDLTQASSYNPAFITGNGGTTAGAEAALFSAISGGKAYLNIHTSSVGSGEIRGFLTPVPEPAETAALTGGLIGAFAIFRRYRSKNAR
jgi:hypothetical protein